MLPVSCEQWQQQSPSHVVLRTPRPDHLPSSAESSVYTDARSSLNIMTNDVNVPGSLDCTANGGDGDGTTGASRCHSREPSGTSTRVYGKPLAAATGKRKSEDSSLVSLEWLIVPRPSSIACHSASLDALSQYSVTPEDMKVNSKHWRDMRKSIQSFAASKQAVAATASSSHLPGLVESRSSSTTLNTTTSSSQTSPSSSVKNNVAAIPRRNPIHYPRPCSSVSECGIYFNLPPTNANSWIEEQQPLSRQSIRYQDSSSAPLRTPATYHHQLGHARCNSTATSAALRHKRVSSIYQQNRV